MAAAAWGGRAWALLDLRCPDPAPGLTMNRWEQTAGPVCRSIKGVTMNHEAMSDARSGTAPEMAVGAAARATLSGCGYDLLLAEDDAELAAILEVELRAFGHETFIVGTGQAALDAAFSRKFDAMLLDWMLPGIDGIGVLERLRDEQLTVPVIMLTALNRLPEKVEGLSAGADDYVTKPASAEEINARIHAVIRGRQWHNRPADIRSCGDIRVSPPRIRAWRGDRALDLSPIDFKLLSELVDSVGAVLTRTMLVERVWGFDFEPTTNIVDSHIRRLRRELTRDGEEDPIMTVRGVGYMLNA